MIDELIRGGRLTSEQVGNGRRLAIANAAKAFRVTPRTGQNHHEAKQASAKGSATVASHQKVEQ
jgi:hypothetical protein